MAERDLPRFASQPFVTITKGGCASVVVVVADVLRWALLAAAIATSLSILATCIVMPVAMKLPLATAELHVSLGLQQHTALRTTRQHNVCDLL
jgi:hypothetical protein